MALLQVQILRERERKKEIAERERERKTERDTERGREREMIVLCNSTEYTYFHIWNIDIYSIFAFVDVIHR